MAGERPDGRQGPDSGNRFAPGAWRYALLALALAVPAAVLARSKEWTRRWGLAAPLLSAGALLFHRDPDRTPPESGVLAPADGRVSVVREERHETDDGNETETRVRVGVFMNVTDVHVNRAPLGGRVRAVEHEPGTHRPAFSKESDNNEKLHVRFADHEVTLVAGAFARRIHPYVEPGDELERGERLGHISFGSRADVLLPPEVALADVAVERGQTVRAGETRLVER
ncbi:protein sorting system archaetidylserine decarboxylase [Halorussus limi]|uniref:Protein sorting system archaetidylserine decarboxylase n=1 Tax=Halorussus limi TaxID=2938695 RepID=A0A8U0HTL8_9EURY|nr:protein sorting system archaetidylserine decarboxylase [Halorussus limi]UPV74199.1 protein sorting system archaetidylserine decarboxylase [Halorussus limi]